MNHYGINPESLEKTINGTINGTTWQINKADFDPYVGRKLYTRSCITSVT
jgi:hypothetical protein